MGADQGDEPADPSPGAAVAAGELLYRRLAPWQFRPDGAVPHQAFRDPQLSVDRAGLTTPVETLARAGRPGFALAAFTAATAQELGLAVVPDPLPDNPAHALVLGDKPKAVCRRLASMATWIISPPAAAP